MAAERLSRLFLDANVLISALRAPGVCEELVRGERRKGYTATASAFVLEEVTEVLARKFRTPPEYVREALAGLDLEMAAEASDLAVRLAARLVGDPKDAPVLAAAIGAGVDALVTGDAHFLTPAVQARVRVLTPREALDWLAEGDRI